MPSHGYNLSVYLEELRALTTGIRSARSSVLNTDLHLTRALNVAHLDLLAEIGITETTTDQALTSGQSDYDLPANILGSRVKAIQIDNSTGNGRIRLTGRTRDAFRKIYNLSDTTATAQGVPLDWAIHETNRRQISIRPIPNYSVASTGIHITHEFVPTPMSRVWRPDKLTPAITADPLDGTLSQIDLSDDPDTLRVAVGDEFGIIPSTGFDEVAVQNQLPLLWFEILTIGTDPDLFTLTEDFQGDSVASGQSFMTAQVPDIERLFPGIAQRTLVDLAASKMLRPTNRRMANDLLSLVNTVLEELFEDGSHFEGRGRRAQAHTNLFTR
jgi:hypothetical protein